MNLPKYLEDFLKTENHIAAGERNVFVNDSFRERFFSGDYLLSEGLTWLDNNKWEKLRGSISRGYLTEARDILAKVTEKSICVLNESIFEEIRIHCYEGQFIESLNKSKLLLKDDHLDPLSRMTCMQMQALSLYELGELEESLLVSERVRSMETLFPRAEAALFTRVTRCRALYDSGAKERSLGELRELWDNIANNIYAVNIKYQLIMFCRLCTQLSRSANKPFSAFALAGYWLAEKMGSLLHRGFFLQDLNYCEDPLLRELCQAEIMPYLKQFGSLRFFKERDTDNYNHANINTGLHIYLRTPPRKVLFLKENFVFDVETGGLSKVNLTSQSKKLLALFKNKPISKKDAYSIIWKDSNYNPLTHDSAIRTALKRLRKQSGIEIVSNDTNLSIPNSLILNFDL